MRPLWIILLAIPVIALAALLLRFNKEQVDRVDLALESNPGQVWTLAPGARQELPWTRGQSISITSMVEKVPAGTGAVVDIGMGLTYRQRTLAKRIEADQPDSEHLFLTLVNVDLKSGNSTRQVFLRVERRGDVIAFEFPKD